MERAPAWGPVQRALFRFLFSYLVLYNFPFPLSVIPVYGEILKQSYLEIWKGVAPWVGEHVFGVEVLYRALRRRGHDLQLRAHLLLSDPRAGDHGRLDAPGPPARQLRAAPRMAAGLRPLRARGRDDPVWSVQGHSGAVRHPVSERPPGAHRRELADEAPVDVHGVVHSLRHLHRRGRDARRPAARRPPHDAARRARLHRSPEQRGHAQLQL